MVGVIDEMPRLFRVTATDSARMAPSKQPSDLADIEITPVIGQVVATTFGYDGAGELVSQTSSTGPATTYTYDDLGHRATSTTAGVVTTYRYDDAGQLCWTSAGSAVNASACGSPPAGATVYAYDLAGRMLSSTSAATTNYGYDPAGQLQTVRLTGGAYDTTQTRTYNPSGDLIGLASTGTNTTSTTLSWDDANPLPTLATQTNGLTTSDLLYGAGQWAIALTGGTIAGIGLDAFGNVIPTAATQGIAAAGSYDAWGTPDAGGDPLSAALGYRGELQTGDLVDLRARNYDTSLGAFLSTDPLDGVNGQTTIAALYAYADNNPIANVDPTGKAANDWNAFAAAWNAASGGAGAEDPGMRVADPGGGYDAVSAFVQMEPQLISALSAGCFTNNSSDCFGSGPREQMIDCLSKSHNLFTYGEPTSGYGTAVLTECGGLVPLPSWIPAPTSPPLILNMFINLLMLMPAPEEVLPIVAKGLATGPDEAVFWSGIAGADKAAASWAGKFGGKTLEQTMAERGVTLPAWDGTPEVEALWRQASAEFARGASGNVVVLQEDLVRVRDAWAQDEFPALKANPAVLSITAVNPTSGTIGVLWVR